MYAQRRECRAKQGCDVAEQNRNRNVSTIAGQGTVRELDAGGHHGKESQRTARGCEGWICEFGWEMGRRENNMTSGKRMLEVSES